RLLTEGAKRGVMSHLGDGTTGTGGLGRLLFADHGALLRDLEAVPAWLREPDCMPARRGGRPAETRVSAAMAEQRPRRGRSRIGQPIPVRLWQHRPEA